MIQFKINSCKDIFQYSYYKTEEILNNLFAFIIDYSISYILSLTQLM